VSGPGETRGRVLAALAAAGGRPVSGEALAQALGISRTSVWKQVAALRRQGYAIAGTRGGGYVLQARSQRLLPAEVERDLATRRLTYRVHHRDVVGSTNDWARALAAAGAPEGTVCLAEEQTAGRGRRGRSWLSPRGGLYGSLLLRPPLPPAALPRLTLMVAVAAAEAIGPAAAIKWPNDLLVAGRKVGGILCELTADDERMASVVVGIGINVAAAPPLPTAGCVGGDRLQLCRALLGHLDDAYDRLLRGRWPELLARWRQRSCTLGRDVVAVGPEGEVRGVAEDVDEDGALLLRAPDGTLRRLLGGEVTLHA
jgi:BirA family biotin operon repressor/biotin-[acetyl-CoA-carboxylase] ligase